MSAYFDVLAKDDPFRNSSKHVELREDGCSEEDIGGYSKLAFLRMETSLTLLMPFRLMAVRKPRVDILRKASF